MNQTITIRIPDDLKEGLNELSRDENKAVSDISLSAYGLNSSIG